MSRGFTFRTAVIVGLLLPGLAIAAPLAGPCGLCGEGDGCHMQPVKPAPETHACCDSTSREDSPESALGSASCECGREVPPALTGEASPTIEFGSALASPRDTVTPVPPDGSLIARSFRQPAPPPTPPAYLVDCAFLT